MDADTNTTVGAIMAVLAILFVGMRFYIRRSKKAGLKWDDWMILVSLLAMIATDVLAMCAISTNPTSAEAATVVTETHDYSPADVLYTKLSWATTIVYFSITSTTKLSILLLYNRIFSVDGLFRRLVSILLAMVVCFWVGCTIANIANCVPMEYSWINSLSDPRYCFNFNIFWFASGICETVIDLLIVLLPVKVVLGLQLSTKKKVAIAFVFLLAGFVVISGLLKAIFGYIPGSRQPSFSKTQLWTTVHCGTGIICACLPVCWPMFAQIKRLGSLPGSSLVRKYWSRVSSRSSSSAGRPIPLRETKGGGKFHPLTANLTSRGFGVSFSGIDRDEPGYQQTQTSDLKSKGPLAYESPV
ncbi:hypothetical protein PG995_008480 [Apiospora arundinis]|jgi:hypothetical protein|uniref:Argonaute/Dicer protein PAZ n=1 Tax=Apiospora arundinis TaxID=335852 RepID=A0ABR2JNL9_9PEZI